MNRRLFQFRYSFERDLVEYFLKVSIGAAGAPTILNGKGIKSMVRNSAGNYTINFQDNANLLLDFSSKAIAAAGFSASPASVVVSEQVSNTSSPSMVVQYDSGTTPTDPASGEVLMIRITVRNAST